MSIDRRHFLLGSACLLPSLSLRAQEDDGFRVLEARPGAASFTPEASTRILGYDGATPGPVLRLRKGDELKIRLVNKLDSPTSIHWRGVRGPNAFDGVAPLVQKPVMPGESFDYRFTPPDSGAFLYHAHTGPQMAAQVMRGLRGLLIVEDEKPLDLDRDLVAVIDDWSLGEDGQIAGCKGDERSVHTGEHAARFGAVGAMTCVNGKAEIATHEIEPRARVRLRLANAASARIMALSLEGARPMVVAIDGQPCGAFEPVRSTLPAGPGARFDMIFDMPEAEGESVRLILRGGPLSPLPAEKDRTLIQFTAKGAPFHQRPPIEGTPANPLLPDAIRLEAARRMDLTIEAAPPAAGLDPAACAGESVFWRMGPPKPVRNGDPLFSVKRGTPVSLGFVNKSQVNHVMRLHGHAMRLLHGLDDGWEPYWRDSVIVPQGRTTRIAFVADNPGRWRIGSGVMEHAVGGLAAFFEVT